MCAQTDDGVGVVVWFHRAYATIGLKGCSSHSGRRTFITRAARLVHKAGGSLRDVQLLAGHRSLQTRLAGPFGFVAEGRADLSRRGVTAGVRRHNTPALFDWLMEI